MYQEVQQKVPLENSCLVSLGCNQASQAPLDLEDMGFVFVLLVTAICVAERAG